jgi:hypothetical protein
LQRRSIERPYKGCLINQTATKIEQKFCFHELKKFLKPEGLLWVTYHKGTSKIKTDINRDSIAEYALSLGLKPVAMISVDEDWSALRLKIL